MTHNIIKTDNYLLIGSDDDIRRGLFYCVRTKNIFQDEGEDIHCCMGDIRIIAHLPLNNSPVLEGIDLLPPLEDENEKLEMEYFIELEKRKEVAKNFTGQVAGRHPDAFGHSEVLHMNRGYIEGYNKAKEKYKYTEEQMKRIYEKGYSAGRSELNSRESDKIKYDYIKSLQQPKMPVAFECEMVTMNKGYTEESDYPYQQCDIPKITTNSQGFTQWVGRYIFKTKNQN